MTCDVATSGGGRGGRGGVANPAVLICWVGVGVGGGGCECEWGRKWLGAEACLGAAGNVLINHWVVITLMTLTFLVVVSRVRCVTDVVILLTNH